MHRVYLKMVGWVLNEGFAGIRSHKRLQPVGRVERHGHGELGL